MPAKPQYPKLQRSHLLARQNMRAFYPACEHGSAIVSNLAIPGQDAILTGGTRIATIDGVGIGLNGSSDYINGGGGPSLPVSNLALTVWARFILRASPANGAYSGIFSQWNEPTVDNQFQRFELVAFNNVFTRPANSIDFTICLTSVPTYSPICTLQYQAGDIGAIWTVVASWNGTTLRHWAKFPSGIVTNSVSASGANASSNVVNTIIGRVDGFYTNMVWLGGAIWTRALTFRDFLDLHRDPWGAIVSPLDDAVAKGTTVSLVNSSPLYTMM